MKVLVKYFASYRQKTGKKEEVVEGDFATVEDLVQHLQNLYGIDTDFLMIAVNRTVVPPNEKLSAEDEVAVFPPVSGG